jgi:hypothetical protein
VAELKQLQESQESLKALEAKAKQDAEKATEEKMEA